MDEVLAGSPNCYVLPKKFNSLKDVTVAEVKKHFPLKDATYHFRFQTTIRNIKAWIETSRDDVCVPFINNRVRIKVLRLPAGVAPKKIPRAPTSQQQPSATAPAPAPAPAQRSSSQTEAQPSQPRPEPA